LPNTFRCSLVTYQPIRSYLPTADEADDPGYADLGDDGGDLYRHCNLHIRGDMPLPIGGSSNGIKFNHWHMQATENANDDSTFPNIIEIPDNYHRCAYKYKYLQVKALKVELMLMIDPS